MNKQHKLNKYTKLRTFSAGTVIFHEGDITKDMYIIQSGEIAIIKNVGGQAKEIIRLGRGDFFGEMSLLESEPRSASATALTDTKVVLLNSGALMLFLRQDPAFAIDMLQTLSSRIRLLNQHVFSEEPKTDNFLKKIATINFFQRISSLTNKN